jgi:hypothetical protein
MEKKQGKEKKLIALLEGIQEELRIANRGEHLDARNQVLLACPPRKKTFLGLAVSVVFAFSLTACGGGASRQAGTIPTPPFPPPVSEPVVIEPVETSSLPLPALPPVPTPAETWLGIHRGAHPEAQIYRDGLYGSEYIVGGSLDGVDLSILPRMYSAAAADILSVRPTAELVDARLHRIVIFREPDCGDGHGFWVGDICATGDGNSLFKIEVVKTQPTVLQHEDRHSICRVTPVIRDEMCPNFNKKMCACIGHSIFKNQPECAVCDPLRGR